MDKIPQSSIKKTEVKLARLAISVSWLIALIGSIALLISVTSPADDAVQHELAPSRSRQVLRLSRTHHRVTALSQKFATIKCWIALSLSSTCWEPASADDSLFGYKINLNPTGDRSPPLLSHL